MAKKREHKAVKSSVFYHALILPGMIFLLLFHFVPMFGLIMAFQDFKPGKGFLKSDFVGLKHFKYFFEIPDSFQIIRNTIVLSVGKLALMTVVAVAFAILLNEIRRTWLKKTVQTVVYLPHFLSWVVLASVIRSMFNLDGMVNNLLGTSLNFIGSNTLFQPLLIFTDVWKEFGFESVIYLAALTSVDPGLHEAAQIDGASWWQRVIHITLPGIRSVIFLMVAKGIGYILNGGFDQVYNLYSAAVYETGDIIDTYVYRVGLNSMQYSFGTAIGLMKSIIGFILLITANHMCKKYTDSKIF